MFADLQVPAIPIANANPSLYCEAGKPKGENGTISALDLNRFQGDRS
jgi:hypothetical protein